MVGASGQGDGKAYLGREPSFTRAQFTKARDLLGQQSASIAPIAKETSLTRQTIYRIKDDPSAAEAAVAAWDCRHAASAGC